MGEKLQHNEYAPDDSIESGSEEWRRFYKEFDEIRYKLLDKIFSLDEEKLKEYFDRLSQKHTQSFTSVDDPSKYVAYHRAISGGTGPISSPKLDFKGEHSLLQFYKAMLNELGEI